ncbi:MAG: FAD:protein FMN transferase [Clostridia bacterium]|nr:FAD:protein FMN transferase [Clostridia bacterium]
MISLLGFSACRKAELYENDFFAMNTYIQLKAYGENSEDFFSSVRAEISHIEGLCSAHTEDSALYLFNSNISAPSPELSELIKTAVEISQATNGAFDPTLLPLSLLWGFSGDREMAVPTEADIAAVHALTGAEKIAVTEKGIDTGGTSLDLGGIAKGYAADKFFQLAEEYGVASAMGSFGGMIAAVGEKPEGEPWLVGLRDPNSDGFAAILAVSSTCISTSGSYERNFYSDGEIYHHILDPKTGYPVKNNLISATVISPEGTEADALSTALFVMGEEGAAEFCSKNGYCAILLTEDGRAVFMGGAEKLLYELSDNYIREIK